MGIAYFTGAGVPTSAKDGVDWLKKAADQKYYLAAYNLSVLYTVGAAGIDRDENEADKWRSVYRQGGFLPEDEMKHPDSYLLYVVKSSSNNPDASLELLKLMLSVGTKKC